MSWKLPVQGRGKWLALFAALVVKTVVSTEAQPAQLALSSQIQYSQVIQGGVDPINAFVYNTAPVGAAAGDYQVTAAYGVGLGNSFKISYQGIRTANGGSVPSGPLAFNLQTASIAPGVVPVAVTLKDTTRGGSITQAGQVTVLAHAAPSLFLGGSPVSLSSRNVITFQTTAVVNGANVFAEAVHAPGGPGGGFVPQMLGDPPGEPTARLDLDSFTTFGSANITSTLKPALNLPSTDTPGTGEAFDILVQAAAAGVYNTTFVVHYSDEQDLPGAALVGSEEAAFNVNVKIEGDVANWTITTGVADTSSTAGLLMVAFACCAAAKAISDKPA